MSSSIEPTRTKTVGRRRPATGLSAANALLRVAIELRAGKPFIPRGVHRFHSFEEAEAWTIAMMTRR
ncbi:MAG TPA: hypothetical protein VML75_11975 [Kofleriaceae bacterium]|nr:hypothetical protein [Kofleriaceae bacterium]